MSAPAPNDAAAAAAERLAADFLELVNKEFDSESADSSFVAEALADRLLARMPRSTDAAIAIATAEAVAKSLRATIRAWLCDHLRAQLRSNRCIDLRLQHLRASLSALAVRFGFKFSDRDLRRAQLAAEYQCVAHQLGVPDSSELTGISSLADYFLAVGKRAKLKPTVRLKRCSELDALALQEKSEQQQQQQQQAPKQKTKRRTAQTKATQSSKRRYASISSGSESWTDSLSSLSSDDDSKAKKDQSEAKKSRKEAKLKTALKVETSEAASGEKRRKRVDSSPNSTSIGGNKKLKKLKNNLAEESAIAEAAEAPLATPAPPQRGEAANSRQSLFNSLRESTADNGDSGSSQAGSCSNGPTAPSKHKRPVAEPTKSAAPAAAAQKQQIEQTTVKKLPAEQRPPSQIQKPTESSRSSAELQSKKSLDSARSSEQRPEKQQHQRQNSSDSIRPLEQRHEQQPQKSSNSALSSEQKPQKQQQQQGQKSSESVRPSERRPEQQQQKTSDSTLSSEQRPQKQLQQLGQKSSDSVRPSERRPEQQPQKSADSARSSEQRIQKQQPPLSQKLVDSARSSKQRPQQQPQKPVDSVRSSEQRPTPPEPDRLLEQRPTVPKPQNTPTEADRVSLEQRPTPSSSQQRQQPPVDKPAIAPTVRLLCLGNDPFVTVDPVSSTIASTGFGDRLKNRMWGCAYASHGISEGKAYFEVTRSATDQPGVPSSGADRSLFRVGWTLAPKSFRQFLPGGAKFSWAYSSVGSVLVEGDSQPAPDGVGVCGPGDSVAVSLEISRIGVDSAQAQFSLAVIPRHLDRGERRSSQTFSVRYNLDPAVDLENAWFPHIAVLNARLDINLGRVSPLSIRQPGYRLLSHRPRSALSELSEADSSFAATNQSAEQPEVMFCVGLPFAGKTKFVETYRKSIGITSSVCLSIDALGEAHLAPELGDSMDKLETRQCIGRHLLGNCSELLFELATYAINRKLNVIMDMCNASPITRCLRLNLFRPAGYLSKAIIFCPGPKTEAELRQKSLASLRLTEPPTAYYQLAANLAYPRLLSPKIDSDAFDEVRSYCDIQQPMLDDRQAAANAEALERGFSCQTEDEMDEVMLEVCQKFGLDHLAESAASQSAEPVDGVGIAEAEQPVIPIASPRLLRPKSPTVLQRNPHLERPRPNYDHQRVERERDSIPYSQSRSRSRSRDIVGGHHRDVVRGTSRDIVSGHPRDVVRGTSRDIVSGHPRDVVRGTSRDIVSGHPRDVVRGTSREIFSGYPRDVVRGTSRDIVSGHHRDVVRGSSRDVVGSHPRDVVRGSSRDIVGGHPRDVVRGSSRDVVGSHPRDIVRGSSRDVVGGHPRDIVRGSSRDVVGSHPRDVVRGSSREIVGSHPHDRVGNYQRGIDAAHPRDLERAHARDLETAYPRSLIGNHSRDTERSYPRNITSGYPQSARSSSHFMSREPQRPFADLSTDTYKQHHRHHRDVNNYDAEADSPLLAQEPFDCLDQPASSYNRRNSLLFDPTISDSIGARQNPNYFLNDDSDTLTRMPAVAPYSLTRTSADCVGVGSRPPNQDRLQLSRGPQPLTQPVGNAIAPAHRSSLWQELHPPPVAGYATQQQQQQQQPRSLLASPHSQQQHKSITRENF